jgi:hypothetical protein
MIQNINAERNYVHKEETRDQLYFPLKGISVSHFFPMREKVVLIGKISSKNKTSKNDKKYITIN